MLAWEAMVGHSQTRWHWGQAEGTAEPAIPWCGHLFPDGTPMSFTEATAIRRYARVVAAAADGGRGIDKHATGRADVDDGGDFDTEEGDDDDDDDDGDILFLDTFLPEWGGEEFLVLSAANRSWPAWNGRLLNGTPANATSLDGAMYEVTVWPQDADKGQLVTTAGGWQIVLDVGGRSLSLSSAAATTTSSKTALANADDAASVSYTHLTLPTIYSV